MLARVTRVLVHLPVVLLLDRLLRIAAKRFDRRNTGGATSTLHTSPQPTRPR